MVDRKIPPKKLELRNLYEDDEILSLAFRQGLTGYPLQLDLLLSEEPLAALMDDSAIRSLLEPEQIGGRTCQRVGIDTDDGRFVLWIDLESSLLRRMEYPAKTFAPEIAQDSTIEELELTAEFRGADLSPSLPPNAFALDVPPQAKRVKKFIPPPRELPSDLFGRITAPFSFAPLAGDTVSSVSLGDRIKVLLWFNNHPACQSTLQQLNQVYEQYQSQERVAIYGVCAEPSSFTAEQIAELMKVWQVSVPVVRDLEAVGRDLFQIPWAPTMIVLDGSNVLHIFEVGANPNLVAELPQVLERLLAGENLAAEILAEFRQERALYEKAIERGEPDLQATTSGGVPVSPETSPKLLQLRPFWTNKDVKMAGNVLAVRDTYGAGKFLVQEGWRTIAELDSQGRLVTRHELDLPELAAVSQLQSIMDGQQQRFYVAWALRSPQVFVFDARWKRVLSYPSADMQHDGVQDAVLADLDGDGKLELCVGFWGTAGVHCLALDGKLKWTNTNVSHVFSLMAAAPVDGRSILWVASASGTVLPLDPLGQNGPPLNLSGQLVHHVFGDADMSATDIPYCGISYGPDGRRLAVGLTPRLTHNGATICRPARFLRRYASSLPPR